MPDPFKDLRDLVAFLRSEQGCPWDREQTLDSLRPHLLEEMHEVCEAIEDNDGDRLREELGDVLFLLIFAARIAEEDGRFSFDEVMEQSYAKMKRRHPHVFGERKDLEPGQVLGLWEKAKRDQKEGSESVLSGLPRGLPALIRAQRVQQRAASLGFDWDNVESVFRKLHEEMCEFEEVWKHADEAKMRDEMGDILFSVVNVARSLGIRAEDALQGTIAKFMERFGHVEKEIAKRGTMSLEEMDAIWDRSKKKGS